MTAGEHDSGTEQGRSCDGFCSHANVLTRVFVMFFSSKASSCCCSALPRQHTAARRSQFLCASASAG